MLKIDTLLSLAISYADFVYTIQKNPNFSSKLLRKVYDEGRAIVKADDLIAIPLLQMIRNRLVDYSQHSTEKDLFESHSPISPRLEEEEEEEYDNNNQQPKSLANTYSEITVSEKYIDTSNVKNIETMNMNRFSSDKLINTANTMNTSLSSRGFDEKIESYNKTRFIKNNDSISMTGATKKLLHSNKRTLNQIYKHYVKLNTSKAVDDFSDKQIQTLDLNGFLQFCKRFNFYDFMTRKDMQNLFNLSLNSESVNKSDNCLTYEGFEELLIRLAIFCYNRSNNNNNQQDSFVERLLEYIGCKDGSWKIKLNKPTKNVTFMTRRSQSFRKA